MNKEEIADRLYELNVHADITVEDLVDEIFDYYQHGRLSVLDKYSWHDLKKDPNDLPTEYHNYFPIEDSGFSDYVLVRALDLEFPIVAYINLLAKEWFNPIEEDYIEDEFGEVIAWREI